ncbi:MAG: hypothetical protein GY795_12650, partial [Desulfobacterales bacterium]|nr:hypothetical protein [Desulfobacterales bacterium]
REVGGGDCGTPLQPGEKKRRRRKREKKKKSCPPANPSVGTDRILDGQLNNTWEEQTRDEEEPQLAGYHRQFRPEAQVQGKGSYVAQETRESYVAQDTVSAYRSNSTQGEVRENTTQLLSEQAADRGVLEETNFHSTNSLDKVMKRRRELEQSKRKPVEGQEKTERRSCRSLCASKTRNCSASSPAEASTEIPGEMSSEEKTSPHPMTLLMMENKNYPHFRASDDDSLIPGFRSEKSGHNKWPIVIPQEILARYNPEETHQWKRGNFREWLQRFLDWFHRFGGGDLDRFLWILHLAYHRDDGTVRAEVEEYMKGKETSQFEDVLDFIYQALLDEEDRAEIRVKLPNITWHPGSEGLTQFRMRLSKALRESGTLDRQFRPSDNDQMARYFLAALQSGNEKEVLRHFGTETAALDDVEQVDPFARQFGKWYKNVQHRENSKPERRADNSKTEGISIVPIGSSRENSGGIISEERSAMQRNPSKKNQEEHSPRHNKSCRSLCASKTGNRSAISPAEASTEIPRKMQAEGKSLTQGNQSRKSQEMLGKLTELARMGISRKLESEEKSNGSYMTSFLQFPKKWLIMIPEEVLPRYDPNIHGVMHRDFHKWILKFLELFQLAGGKNLDKSVWTLHLAYHLNEEWTQGVMDYMKKSQTYQFQDVLNLIHFSLSEYQKKIQPSSSPNLRIRTFRKSKFVLRKMNRSNPQEYQTFPDNTNFQRSSPEWKVSECGSMSQQQFSWKDEEREQTDQNKLDSLQAHASKSIKISSSSDPAEAVQKNETTKVDVEVAVDSEDTETSEEIQKQLREELEESSPLFSSQTGISQDDFGEKTLRFGYHYVDTFRPVIPFEFARSEDSNS